MSERKTKPDLVEVVLGIAMGLGVILAFYYETDWRGDYATPKKAYASHRVQMEKLRHTNQAAWTRALNAMNSVQNQQTVPGQTYREIEREIAEFGNEAMEWRELTPPTNLKDGVRKRLVACEDSFARMAQARHDALNLYLLAARDGNKDADRAVRSIQEIWGSQAEPGTPESVTQMLPSLDAEMGYKPVK